MRFVYTVWFRDSRLPADDQDYEWPACFVVEASTGPEAASWGDRIALKYSAQRGQQMLSSFVEPFARAHLPGKQDLPMVPFGYDASDDEIGWQMERSGALAIACSSDRLASSYNGEPIESAAIMRPIRVRSASRR